MSDYEIARAEQYEDARAKEAVMKHDKRCDRDLCHPDCPRRKWAELNDRPYPGKK